MEQSMSQPSATEQVRTQLLACLEEAFENVRGIYLDRGTSLFETIADVSAAEASRGVADGRATIAAHVEHVRFYLYVLDDVMRTRTLVKVDWRAIWQSVGVVTPEQWTQQKARLRESYERVVSTISSYDPLHGEHGLASALAVVAHSAYHLGAIRQILGAVRSTELRSAGPHETPHDAR
jgi:hypothetical protein